MDVKHNAKALTFLEKKGVIGATIRKSRKSLWQRSR